MANLQNECELKAALKAANRAQKEIAQAVGISERHLRRIFSGQRPCTQALRQRLLTEASRVPDHWCHVDNINVHRFLVD
jgi:plasmid maintenance system antidote protein VapI